MIMFSRLAATALILPFAAPAAAQGQPPAADEAGLTLEHRMLLRCSAAFALVADGQERGDAQALGYPEIADPGREFFVRAMARVMDDTGMGREAVTEELTHEAERLSAGDRLGEIMPACLTMLEDNPVPPGAMR